MASVGAEGRSHFGNFGTGRAKLALDRYFGVDRASNRVDVRAAGGQASCCGVNLAFAGLGVGGGFVGGFGFGDLQV